MIVLFGTLGAALHLALAFRRSRHDRLLSTLVALVCVTAAAAWSY